MTRRTSYKRPGKQSDHVPLVSLSTILILSGCLIGVVASQLIARSLQGSILAIGIVGMLSFIALDHVKLRRIKRAEEHEQLYVEGRLSRHVDRCTTGEDMPDDTAGFETSAETYQSAG